MRILYVIDSLVPAGAEQSLVTMLPHLVQRGIDPVVVHLSSAPGLQDRVDQAGIARVALDPVNRRDAVRLLRREIRRHRPDLVHTTLFEADLAGRVAAATTRTPVVSTFANVAYGPEQAADRQLSPTRVRAAQLADAATTRLVRRFHAVSETVAEVMSKRLLVPRSKIDVVPRGRDRARLGEPSPERRSAVRSALGIDDGTVVGLAIGRHEFQKGLDLLVEALGQMSSPPPFLIVGREGNQTRALQALIDELELTPVRLLGHRDDVADLLVAADLAVFPSRWEGMPGAVVEAMALQVPVLASDIPQHEEVLADVALGYFAAGDAGALASAMERALTEPRAEQRARCIRGRERFESRFAIAVAADGMATFYERALEGTTGRQDR